MEIVLVVIMVQSQEHALKEISLEVGVQSLVLVMVFLSFS